MKYQLLTEAFQQAQHIPQIAQMLKLHFNLYSLDISPESVTKKAAKIVFKMEF